MEEYSIELKLSIVQDPPKKVMEGHIDSKKTTYFIDAVAEQILN